MGENVLGGVAHKNNIHLNFHMFFTPFELPFELVVHRVWLMNF